MLVAGIDEAGYGPLLGPLVVAATAFRVTAPAGDPFAGRVRRACSACGLVVGDSKRVFGPTKDLARLERPLLAFLAAAGHAPGSLDELLACVGVDPGVRRCAPWYGGDPSAFPLRADADAAREAGLALREALAAEGVEFAGAAADVVAESRFNAALHAGNKADALFAVSTGVFERVAARRRDGDPLVAVFDRHGGRQRYATSLQRRWPESLAWTVGETPRRSDYRMSLGGAAADVSFVVEADHEFPQVGLASMLAKYLREAFMERFNDYFSRLAPGVTPTAGYVEDGRRWLEATRGARASAGVPDSDLVRRR
jgi:hypothetical protein